MNENLKPKKDNYKIENQSFYLGDFKVFEGEYINIERNGKGKEYYQNNRKKFEGEYLNGKIWNGKGYDKEGKEIFEIKDGKGYIKEYDYDGELLFEGEYINGEKKWKR